LWIAAQLAAGLAHAHERGILHRDLKPANVLLTDDGVPMLLDFNLAEDTKDRSTGQRVGGTLPYMAPEQLDAFIRAAGAIDGRADLYALGLILFELLTGSRPFPDRKADHRPDVRRMLQDRLAGAPLVRAQNRLVAPAVESIVAKCLAPDPANRYASARDLHEDLIRHLADRPLKYAPNPSLRERVAKWRRRHPRLSSATSVALLAAVLLALTGGGLYSARERARTFEARVAFTDHGRALGDLQTLLDDRNQTRASLDSGVAQCRAVLARYGVSPDAVAVPSDWNQQRLVNHLAPEERSRLRDDFGEVFYLMAKAAGRSAELAPDESERAARLEDAARWNRLAAGYGGARIPRAVLAQRADLERLAGRPEEAARSAAEAARTAPASARDRYLLGYWHHHQGRFRQAAEDLDAATTADPSNFSSWFVRGTNHLALEQNDLAAMCFTACIALRADFAPVWINRGVALARLRKFDLALCDYAEAERLAPGGPDVHILRGGVLQAQEKHREAVEAFTAALAAPGCPTRVYSYRSSARRRSGDLTGAAADEAAALKLTPTEELSWMARAEARLRAGDARAALADVEGALRANPRSWAALQLQAHLLAEQLGDPKGARRALDRAVELYPDSAPARAGRAVLAARAGERADAHRDAEFALQLDTAGPNLYQVGCVYALTARTHPTDRFRACELLAAALRAGFGREHLAGDTDLDPIRRSPEFQKLTELR
jgi:tetratricopeptide (TPR) repeat protein